MQTKADSLMEAGVNVGVGFLVSLAGSFIILPLVLGIHASLAANLAITALYTVLSLIRQYVLRRLFNGRTVWQALKGRLRL